MTEEVYLDDAKMTYDQSELYFMQADFWAQEHCTSYRGCHIQDVSDVSYVYDNIGMYLFDDPRDATAFRLRWK